MPYFGYNELLLVARGAGSQDHGRNNHGCDVTPLLNDNATTVFVAGFGAARNGDMVESHNRRHRHGDGYDCHPHVGINGGSPEIVASNTSVLVEGQPIARQNDRITGTDPTSCGKVQVYKIGGAPTQTTVFAGL